ncbi:MAG: sigma-54 dependent transcriptional regulator [FCB group bacterium]|nr:sigma-54 dependent transcriptional regulator [FCB group bacterium]
MPNGTPEKKFKVLVASGDVAYAHALAHHMEVDGYRLHECHSEAELLRRFQRDTYDVLVLDLDLSEKSDVDPVSFVRRQNPETQIVVICEITKVERAIEAVRQGAFFFLPRTCQESDVALVVRKAVRSIEVSSAVTEFEQSLFEELLGNSPQMRRVVELISKVSPTDSTVLLLGESGTGKDILAQTVHRLSHRRDLAFIAVNCAALPETLLESELFGHVRGAFTGAESDKRGLFEEADGGTIFLDEIGDMALVTQAKLLRVLQNGEIRPVGSSVSRKVDVRVVAATNQDLVESVKQRTFREDLYFRLNVIQIRIPPLRERMDALPRLVSFFLARYNAKYGKQVQGPDEQAQVLLRNYNYPGNVRELESIIAHAVILCDGNTVHARDLPDHVQHGLGPRLALTHDSLGTDGDLPTLVEMEERLIRSALERYEGNQTEVAKHLGISRSTLWRKMKEYNINAG